MEKHITIGIAGHVDHGKTTLVRSLTGVETDRLFLEKRRGLSIEASTALLRLPSGRQVALVDVPGHSSFNKNTIRGLSCVDMAVLVVAADDGVMPQTLDHMEILRLFGIKSGFIVLSKTDLVDQEILELAELEVCEAVKGTFLEAKSAFAFSAIDQRGLEDILGNIETNLENIAGKDLKADFRLWIDQVKTVTGFGTVVAGTVLSGNVSQNDTLHILPGERKTRARFLEVHHERVTQAFAGQRVSINLHNQPFKTVKRGMVLAKPGSVRPSYLLNAELEVLKSTAKPIGNRHRVKLHLGTSITNTLVVLMEKEELRPGEIGLVQFRLMRPVAVLPKDPFVISHLGDRTIAGGGIVFEVPRQKFRAAKAKRILPYLKALQKGDLKAVIESFLERKPDNPVLAEDVARYSGISMEEVHAEISASVDKGNLLYFKGRGYLKKEHYELLKRKAIKVAKEILSENPLKLTLHPEEIRNRLRMEDAPFQRMLKELRREGKLAQADFGFRVPNFSARLSPKLEKLAAMLLDYAENAGFVHFSADTFWKHHKKKFNKNEIQRLLDYLHGHKKLIRLNNNRFLTPQAIEKIKEEIRHVIIRKGCLTLADSKEILGYGRTGGVPILEYLDEIGFVCRKGDVRILQLKKSCASPQPDACSGGRTA